MAQFSICFRIDIKLLLFAAKFVLGAAFSTLDEDDWDTSKDVLYKMKRPLLLECNVTEEPEVLRDEYGAEDLRYRWYKDGRPIELSDKYMVPRDQKNCLLVTYTNEDDEGTYLCHVKTSFGTASSAPMTVKRMYVEFSSDPVQTETHFVEIRQMHKLECPGFYSSYPRGTLTWKIQLTDVPIISYTILERHITTGHDGNLYFAYINKEDADPTIQYVCVGEHPALDKPVTLASYVLQLAANSTPQPINMYPETYIRYPQDLSNLVVAKEGDPAMLYCIFAGAPILHPDWYFGNTNVNGAPSDRVTRRNRSAGKRLLIKETHLSDQGIYQCRITENGKETVHSMELNVVSAPNVTKKSDYGVKIEEGENVTFVCIVKGYPKPTVSWVHNGEPLPLDAKEKNPRFSVPETSEDSETTVDKSLTISKIWKVDKGYYGCKASNKVGVAYEEFLMIVE